MSSDRKLDERGVGSESAQASGAALVELPNDARSDRLVDSQTINCLDGRHRDCGGYITPLVYANTRRCECGCHEERRLPILAGETIEVYNARVRGER